MRRTEGSAGDEGFSRMHSMDSLMPVHATINSRLCTSNGGQGRRHGAGFRRLRSSAVCSRWCLMLWWTLFQSVLLLRVEARKCGTTLTEECKATWDKRYDPNFSTLLPDQAVVWAKLPGLYEGLFHSYDPETFERMIMTEQEFVDFTGTNAFRLSPSTLFVNFTVDDTRVYRHSYTIQQGRFDGARPGRVIYCDSWSMATWEKNGIPHNFQTNCSGVGIESLSDTSEHQNILPDGSNAYPLGEYGVAFYEKYPGSGNDEGSDIRVVDTFSCTDDSPVSTNSSKPSNLSNETESLDEESDGSTGVDSCQRLSYVHERYVDGQRTVYQVGELVRIPEVDQFTQAIVQAYNDNAITERDQLIPSSSTGIHGCLNGELTGNRRLSCRTDREFCTAGDPRCYSSPYQEPEGEVKPGVITAFVLGGVIFLILLAYLGWRISVMAQMQRAKEFFAWRLVETILKEPLVHQEKKTLELTQEEMKHSFQRLEEHYNKGIIQHDSMYTYLSAGPNGYMDYWDFKAFWKLLNTKKNGTVDFLEYCSILARCCNEFDQAAQDIIAIERQPADEQGDTTVSQQQEQQHLVETVDEQENHVEDHYDEYENDEGDENQNLNDFS